MDSDEDQDIAEATEAINRYFGNTRRSQRETASGLRSLIADIETMIESLDLKDDE